MRLNESCNVLWHKSCKCVCLLNSSVCNSKQIWNSDTCRCDCNEDFAGIINCTKCEGDVLCKPGQYLVNENCVCKNKLVGRVIGECTNVINETIMNNRVNINDNNTAWNIFIGLFSVVIFIGIVCSCVLIYFKCIKGKKLFKKYNNY